MKKEKITERINRLLKITEYERGKLLPSAIELYSGAISLGTVIYGAGNSQVLELKAERERITNIQTDNDSKYRALMYTAVGFLECWKSEVNQGLVEQIETEAQADIYASLLALGKQCFEDNAFESAAVLVSAGIEDALKKFAASNGLSCEEDEMTTVISKLKGKGVLKKSKAKILQSYVTLRNKSLHAEWAKIEKESVGSALGFLEQFIITSFTDAQEQHGDTDIE